ncbi:MAG: hypothetical protein PHN39_03745 [Candidatus Pacebacteria bacterium]|nr:hypothetical protein [Candidatus Paceibacterota bacterium]
MKLYFAGDGWSRYLLEFGGRNKLISYPYYLESKILREELELYDSIFMDSGAFSVYTGKKKVDIDQMIDDYKKMPKNWVLAGLDVIGNAEQTKKNCDYMTSKDVTIIPTYHLGHPLSYLEYYCQNYDYIALGGVITLKSYTKIYKALSMAFSVIKNYWPIKIHGFAITSKRLMFDFPFYSIDSTSWLTVVRFGNYNSSEINKMYSLKRNHRKLLKDSVENMLKLEKQATKLWSERGITWQK